MMTTAILILAAGASKRMGTPKQLLPYKKGSLLSLVVNRALLANPKNVFVVIGANKVLMQKELESLDVSVLENKNWDKGIGNSIAYGISQINRFNKYQRVLVLLADQPSVTSDDLHNLIQFHQLDKKQITITHCNNYKGVPAVFEKELFLELMKLSGDFGAKSIMKQHKKDISIFRINKNIWDVDTKEDYDKIINGFNL